MTWLEDGGLSITPPKSTKKITGTRFGAILGENVWSTPFKMWCEITKTYQEPFEDSIYTIAGKKIESKQIDWYAMLHEGIVRPEDVYGKDFFKSTHGDFFPTNKIFGGMWDATIPAERTVIECKTTKRSEDWQDDIPEYYALQAALYGYLLGFDNVIFIATILDEEDYPKADEFEVSSNNTFTRKFKISERYPDFDKKIDYCIDWFNDMVLTGFSPIPDYNKDAELLKILHTELIDSDADLMDLIKEYEELYSQVAEVKKSIAKTESRCKKLAAEIKEKVTAASSGDERYEIVGSRYKMTITPSRSEGIDTDKLKEDGIYENYKIVKPVTYKFTLKEIK